MESRIHNNKIQVVCSKAEAKDLIKHFYVLKPGYQFDPRVQSGRSDGKIKFYKINALKTGEVLLEFNLGFKDKLKELGININLPYQYKTEEILNFLKKEIPKLPFKPRKYQLKMIIGMIQNQIHLGIVATGGGKSLIFYLVSKFLYEKNQKTILIVPTINLVDQMYGDIKDYNAPEGFLNDIQLVGGEHKDKKLKKPIVISTWQSLSKTDISGYDCLYVDEVHKAAADTLQDILSKNVKKKIGQTGSMPNLELESMKLEQIFGKPNIYANAKDLINLGLLTKTTIIALFLNYPRSMTRSGLKYQEEMKLIKESPQRLEFLVNLLNKVSTRGITVCTFNTTKFGETLFESVSKNKKRIKNNFEKQKEIGVFFIDGKTKSSLREQIRQYLNSNESKNEILIAQTTVIDTGTNIPKLKNIVFGEAPGKKFTKILQSIGRVMRKSKDSGNNVYVWDIVDCFDYVNETYALQHFWERLQYYENEGHPVIEEERHLK